MEKKTTIGSFLVAFVLIFTQTHAQFAVRVEPNIPYGSAINYAGCSIDLFVDLYKPVNNDASRPLMVLVHGGAFISGERTDGNMVALANEMASRGHVVASVSYRLGWHTTTLESGNCAFGCWTGSINIPACLYAADTLETYRAAYRAMQDVKGAIRFLKNRSGLDSTDIYRVSVGGHSAGAVTSLLVGYMDKEAERPAPTYAQDLAPSAYVTNACSTVNTCGGTSKLRGDLGSIRGSLHLSGADESVHAVMTFAGALPDLSILDNDTCKPSLYVFHQSCDHIVPNQTGRFFSPLNNCLYYCCPQPSCRPVTGMPMVYGGEAIVTHVANNSSLGINLLDDLVARGGAMTSYYGCVNGDPNIHSCTNPAVQNCHDMAMDPNRYQNIANFLNAAPSLNPAVPCTPVGISEEISGSAGLYIYPNPHSDHFVVMSPLGGGDLIESLECVDAMGKAVPIDWTRTPDGALIQINAAAGIYAVRLKHNQAVYQARVVKAD